MDRTRNMRIVIPGGTGQVGQILARAFVAEGHDVVLLSRGAKPAAAGRVVAWSGTATGDWTQEIDGADVLINLAGRSVDCRYDAANRRAIMDSRVVTTNLLGKAMRRVGSPPPLWMNASTATIYRHALDRPMDEATGELGGSEPGAPGKWNFSIDVARAWEEAFFANPVEGVRQVALRSAMTMSPDPGGIFDVMRKLVRVGLGGPAGSGRQYVSWIHDADFVAAVQFIMERPELSGPVNVASPNPLPNREFFREFRRAWGMPAGLPATEWMLEIGAILLRTETELVLKSRRVVPGRLLDAGFRFRFPSWPGAVDDLCRRMRAG